jgi:hypothetical protein
VRLDHLLSREEQVPSGTHFPGRDGILADQPGAGRHQEKSQSKTQEFRIPDWFPLSSGWGHHMLVDETDSNLSPNRHLTNQIGYSFNFAEAAERTARVEAEEKIMKGRLLGQPGVEPLSRQEQTQRTS